MTSYIIIMMNLRGVAASVVDNQLLIEDASSPERPLKKSKLVNDTHFTGSPRYPGSRLTSNSLGER